ncbi:MAG: KH domain-containing protein [Thermofilaceae archaeon]
MYHIMVYSRGFESLYSRPYAVHLFSSNKLSPDEAFKRAEEILTKAFSEWREGGLAYAGYEHVPVDVDDTYYVAVRLSKDDFKAVSTIPQSLASAIEEYRERQLTLDVDRKDDYAKAKLIDALNYLRNHDISFKLYETHRGYHVRAQLPRSRSLKEIIEMRDRLDDDLARLKIDSIYLRHGLGFLTNLLFHEKYWRDEPDGALQRTVETEVDPSAITVEFKQRVCLNLPELTISTHKGIVEVKGFSIIFKGRFGLKETEAIIKSIEDNFWEYGLQQRTLSDVKESVKSAYRKISPVLALLIDKCQVSFSDGVVVIHVPEDLATHVGRLIGKQGANVKAVETELGVRIKISQSAPPPEDVELKKKLQELLRRVV